MKDVRIKVLPGNYLDSIGISVEMNERNVSEYDGYIKGKITRFNQFIEFEGGRSAGCPDLTGQLHYRGNQVNYKACNMIFRTPSFTISGNDGKELYYQLSEGNNQSIKLDGVNYFLKRLNNGDGCILFELYVDVMVQGEPTPIGTVHHRNEL